MAEARGTYFSRAFFLGGLSGFQGLRYGFLPWPLKGHPFLRSRFLGFSLAGPRWRPSVFHFDD
jgi:hypothetical protein